MKHECPPASRSDAGGQVLRKRAEIRGGPVLMIRVHSTSVRGFTDKSGFAAPASPVP
jgi:hypothetical protein